MWRDEDTAKVRRRAGAAAAAAAAAGRRAATEGRTSLEAIVAMRAVFGDRRRGVDE